MRPEPKRSLGLPDLVALGINSVIGTGIFFLPGLAADELGPAAVLSFLIAAALCSLLVLSFAEVGSRFQATGGSMLYATEAFGSLAGFSVGWLLLGVRVAGCGALSNVLVNAAGTLVPAVGDHRKLAIVVLISGVTAMNLGGIEQSARAINLFTVAKLLPMLAFIAVGLFHVDVGLYRPFAPHGYGELGSVTLLIFYAFVGFELLAIPAGEVRQPQRDTPRALLLSMSVVTVVYLLIWAVCAGTLPTLAGSANPVAEAAATFLGPRGALIIKLGIFFSVLGITTWAIIAASRLVYAMAVAGHLPQPLTGLSPRTGAPVLAALAFGAAAMAAALSGTFAQLAVLSVLGRIGEYLMTCAAVLRLRARRPAEAPPFRLPLGPVVPVAAMLLCLWLLVSASIDKLLWGLGALLLGLVCYWLRHRPTWT